MVLSFLKFNNFFFEILNLKGCINCITGSRVMAILLNGYILPVGGASAMEGLQLTGLPLLVSQRMNELFNQSVTKVFVQQPWLHRVC